jgi:ubiquinone/menaquinone biosynthesis C-methylase UbiE
MNNKVWETRIDDHDFMTPEHIDGFLRNHYTGTDNNGRLALARIVSSYKNATVLDAACGTCVNWEVFRNNNVVCRYTGLDRTQGMVDNANQRYGDEITAQQGYLEELPFEDESFDIVILRHILEHLEEGYETAITEAIRVAKNEVVIVFFLPPVDVEEDQIRESEPDKNGATHFMNEYSHSKFMTFISEFGYRIEKHFIPTVGAAHHDTIIRIIK